MPCVRFWCDYRRPSSIELRSESNDEAGDQGLSSHVLTMAPFGLATTAQSRDFELFLDRFLLPPLSSGLTGGRLGRLPTHGWQMFLALSA